jgi:hypothetical protein
MIRNEVEEVLHNWIGEALSETGFPQGTDRARWVASCFARWWKSRVEQALGEAELAASGIHNELLRLGGWEKFGEALHEHCHLQEALADLRTTLGLDKELHP